MRRVPARFWLILLLLAGVSVPAPRMAGHLIAGRHQPGPPLGRKPSALRGLNRLGSPAPTACVQVAAFRVGAPEPPRPAPPVFLIRWPWMRGIASIPVAPAPIAPRLRC